MTHHRGSFAPRRWGIAIAVLALTCGATRVAAADPILPPGEASPDNVTYEFRFDELSSKFGETWPSFSIALTFPSWVQTLGVHRTPAPIPTPYGFDVNYVYTNSIGFFGFTSDARASITGNSFTWHYGAGFLFSPTPSAVNYFRQPGTYSGTVYGHAPFAIGSATLSIMGTPEPPAPVPEPTSILLVTSGASLLVLKYRQRGRKKPGR